MNVADERSTPCWIHDVPAITARRCEAIRPVIVVIGSGIAGLSIAYERSRFDRSVIVIDRGGIACGMTARSTAHLATELDDFYSGLQALLHEGRLKILRELADAETLVRELQDFRVDSLLPVI